MADSKVIKELTTFSRNDEGSVQLRWTLDEYGDAQYVSARIWNQDHEGKWHPTQKGITIRAREIMQVGKALRTALDAIGGEKPQNTPRPRTQTEPGEDLSAGGRL